jgi:hypothetical protein
LIISNCNRVSEWVSEWVSGRAGERASEWVSEWVSEWLLFNNNSVIFQLDHDENRFIFNEIMMRSASF